MIDLKKARQSMNLTQEQLGDLVGVVRTTIAKGLPSQMLSLGGDIVKGIWNGISNMTGWIVGKVQSFASSVLGGIKSALGIHSPSRVMRDQVGKQIAEGVAVGIEDNEDAPIKAMKNMAGDVAGAAQGFNGLQVERNIQHSYAVTQAAAAAPVGLSDKLDKILAAIERGQILTIDKKLLVGGTAGDYDTALGERRVLVGMGAL